MKILIVHDFGQRIGGAEQMSASLREGLRSRGHAVRWFASSARVIDAPNEADDICWGTTSPLRRLSQVANPVAARSLRRLLHDFRPDVVHVRMFLNQLSPLILNELRGVPALLHVVIYELTCPINLKRLPDGSLCRHEPGMVCWRQGCVSLGGLARLTIQRKLLRSGFDAFDRVIANSMHVGRRLEEEGWRVDGHVYNGMPRCEPRPPLNAPPSICFAGRLTREKGIDVLLDAYEQVRRRIPEVELLIAGDGPLRGEVEQRIGAMGESARVKLLGHLDRTFLQQALAGAWVQAVPSVWEEPFGIVAAEAMMRGTAVVAAASGGLAEQVVEGVSGYLVPPGDAAAMAEAFQRVLSDRDHAEALGRAGRERAVREFSLERFIDRFEAIYGDMLRTASLR